MSPENQSLFEETLQRLLVTATKADNYRRRAEVITGLLERKTNSENSPLRQMQKALNAMAENEDWLDGK